jgi:hypothetical protein
MDIAEVYAPMREWLWLTVLFVGVLLFGLAAAVVFLWRQQHAALYREKYEAECEYALSIQRLNRELDGRNRIAQVFLAIPDNEMYNEVLKIILNVTESTLGAFGYIDEAGNLVVPTMTRQAWDKCQVPGKPTLFPRDNWGESAWPRALREKRTIFSNEIPLDIPSEDMMCTPPLEILIDFVSPTDVSTLPKNLNRINLQSVLQGIAVIKRLLIDLIDIAIKEQPVFNGPF